MTNRNTTPAHTPTLAALKRAMKTPGARIYYRRNDWNPEAAGGFHLITKATGTFYSYETEEGGEPKRAGYPTADAVRAQVNGAIADDYKGLVREFYVTVPS